MTLRTTSRRRFLAVCGGMALSGCSQLVPGTADTDGGDGTKPGSAWPMFGTDPANTGYDLDGTVPDDPTEQWSASLGEFPYTSPVVAGGHAFIGSGGRGVMAFDAASGDRRWQTPLAGTPAGTPAVADGTVFVTGDRRLAEAGDAFVRALDASSGAERWRTRVDDTAVFAPTVADGAVYVRTSTTLAALDAGDGSVRWTVGDRAAFDKPDYDLTMDMSPAVRDDTVYFPGPRAVVAVAAETGSIRWRTEATNVRSAPAVVDGTVYVPDVSAGVSAIDARTGDEQWSWEATGCWTSPAVADGRVYTTEGFDVVALDAADGAEVWRTGSDGLHGDSYSAPAVVGSTVVAGSISASVSALTAGDGGLFDSPGSVNWNMGAGTRTSPAVADGTVYAAAFSTRPRENALLALG